MLLGRFHENDLTLMELDLIEPDSRKCRCTPAEIAARLHAVATTTNNERRNAPETATPIHPKCVKDVPGLKC
jgi:hypothetical protein